MTKEIIISQIHDILGTLDPPELRDIKTQRIILLYAKILNRALFENTRCTPMCDGFHKYENILSDLMDNTDKQMEVYYCTSCMAMFKEECCCDEEPYTSTEEESETNI